MASDTGNAWRAVPGHADGCECPHCLTRPRITTRPRAVCGCHRRADGVVILCERCRAVGLAGVRAARAQTRGRTRRAS
jgi:hypothetical protein